MLGKISINKKQKDSGIEELNNKDTLGNQLSLSRLSVFSDIVNQFNYEKSKCKIDDNDHKWNSLSGSHTFSEVFWNFKANFFTEFAFSKYFIAYTLTFLCFR